MTTIAIAAGGTGGHLYPAVALAKEFLRRDPTTAVLFVGTARGIESKVLAHEGFELAMIAAQPVMGRGLLKGAGALLSLPVSVAQSLSLLRARQPSLVIGVGGYTSPPVLFAAVLMGVPRVILEPNAYPGMANKALAPFAQVIFVAFQEAAARFGSSQVRVSGTPIRRAFFAPSSTLPPVGGGPERGQTLLIFGGSQGSRAINDAMIGALPQLASRRGRLLIVHQTGEADHARVKAAYETAKVEAQVVPFLFDMPAVLRSADLVVSRAGAMTVAELTACGKPAIVVPLPQAIYQHQAHNAQVLAGAGGAVVLQQQELTGARLAQEITALLDNPARLRAMGERSQALGRTDAAEVIVQECLALIKKVARG